LPHGTVQVYAASSHDAPQKLPMLTVGAGAFGLCGWGLGLWGRGLGLALATGLGLGLGLGLGRGLVLGLGLGRGLGLVLVLGLGGGGLGLVFGDELGERLGASGRSAGCVRGDGDGWPGMVGIAIGVGE